MLAIIPIFMPRFSSEPCLPPKCPHCGKNLWGWREPAERGWRGVISVLMVLSAIGLAAFCLHTLLYWSIVDHSQTLAQFVASEWRWFVELLRRIW